MTHQRLISGLVFAAIFLLGLFNPYFRWIPPVVSIIGAVWGMWEFSHLGEKHPPRPQLALSIGSGLALLLDGYFFNLSHGMIIIGMTSVCTIAAGLTLRGVDVAALAGKSVIAPIYAALPIAMVLALWKGNIETDAAWPNKGAHYILFLIIVTWCGDIGAYFAGRWFGKHKLAPTLSPGKTREGFAGGVILTVIVALAIKAYWNNINSLFGWGEVVFFAVAFSVIGPIGDLAESQLKRAAGVKDSGRTFTGHGGMLDIIDSLLFTTVFYYAYLQVFHGEFVRLLR